MNSIKKNKQIERLKLQKLSSSRSRKEIDADIEEASEDMICLTPPHNEADYNDLENLPTPSKSQFRDSLIQHGDTATGSIFSQRITGTTMHSLNSRCASTSIKSLLNNDMCQLPASPSKQLKQNRNLEQKQQVQQVGSNNLSSAFQSQNYSEIQRYQLASAHQTNGIQQNQSMTFCPSNDMINQPNGPAVVISNDKDISNALANSVMDEQLSSSNLTSTNNNGKSKSIFHKMKMQQSFNTPKIEKLDSRHLAQHGSSDCSSGLNSPRDMESTPMAGSASQNPNAQYKCTISGCDRRFTQRTSLRHHLRTHTGEKPFACQYCGWQFATKGNKIDHERRHQNLRPYKCNTCGKAFYRPQQLKSHTVKCKKESECSIPTSAGATAVSVSPFMQSFNQQIPQGVIASPHLTSRIQGAYPMKQESQDIYNKAQAFGGLSGNTSSIFKQVHQPTQQFPTTAFNPLTFNRMTPDIMKNGGSSTNLYNEFMLKDTTTEQALPLPSGFAGPYINNTFGSDHLNQLAQGFRMPLGVKQQFTGNQERLSTLRTIFQSTPGQLNLEDLLQLDNEIMVDSQNPTPTGGIKLDNFLFQDAKAILEVELDKADKELRTLLKPEVPNSLKTNMNQPLWQSYLNNQRRLGQIMAQLVQAVNSQQSNLNQLMKAQYPSNLDIEQIKSPSSPNMQITPSQLFAMRQKINENLPYAGNAVNMQSPASNQNQIDESLGNLTNEEKALRQWLTQVNNFNNCGSLNGFGYCPPSGPATGTALTPNNCIGLQKHNNFSTLSIAPTTANSSPTDQEKLLNLAALNKKNKYNKMQQQDLEENSVVDGSSVSSSNREIQQHIPAGACTDSSDSEKDIEMQA